MKNIFRIAAGLLIVAWTALPVTAAADAVQKQVAEVAKKAGPAFVFLGGGSGILISADGYFLTNHHVIQKIRLMSAQLHDGKLVEIEKVGIDPVGDIALMKIKSGKNLPFVEFGDSDALEVGRPVVAIGNPFGLAAQAMEDRREPTVTLGIVSAVHRYQGNYSDAIQTDAAINPGNSGGPLFTLDGKLVGINGRIATRFFNRVNSGVGFAIPSSQIRRFLEPLKAGGVNGVVPHGLIVGLNISRKETEGGGAVVGRIEKGSSAEKAGFREGDLIVRFDTYVVGHWRRLLGILGAYPAGAKVDIVVEREAKKTTLAVTLEEKPASPDEEEGQPRGYLGIGVEQTDEGIAINNVAPGTPAEAAGLQIGDIIIKFNGAAVKSPDDVVSVLRASSPEDEVEIVVRRAAKTMTIKIKLVPHPG